MGTTNKTVTVGTSAVEIAAEVMPTQRKSIFITNTSTSTAKVSISVAGNPATGLGIVLSPGGFYAISANGKAFPNHQQYLAISDTAGATLAIQEVMGNQEADWANCIVGGDISISSGRVTADVSGSVSTALPTPSSTQTLVRASVAGKAGQSITAGTGALLYTVTGGKTFYMTAFNLSSNGGANWELRDGTTIAGSVKLGGQNLTGNQHMPFPTPVSFATGVFLDLTPTATYGWFISGFEQ